ncbi:MAG: hypothetical protein DMF68_16090 [Acidobacteria bacterium]|nr:MAG: hypothetical protein DMF68_16090 [Acidobacteriota bacterium]
MLDNHFDNIAAAIRGARETAEEMVRLDKALREELDNFEAHLQTIISYSKIVESPEAEKFLRRVERLRELRNMAELGSLSIEVARGMDETWRRLPK